ncbi:uncharacterized protein A4U43_C04F8040 [Asparagus officinalis]|uniref:KIB1-4 beta-propeller domain-containing protein n=1 Tax=Asparagus officinalis TaxID=4686 RepID=A0A5P1F3M3_ASPOF|nr:F-box protein SKIP23-like [Asparagus officinalis]ONK71389.1 uncharacterized protein A4U43_C04F8040 [Asparagus officinalis]
MTDWSLLPEDFLRLILDKLSSPLDNARSGAVCKLWHSICKQKTFPWLLPPDPDPVHHKLCLFSLSDQEVYHIKLPELENKVIWGASHGWLVTMDEDFFVCLLDPFSKTQIQLPQNLKVNKRLPLRKVVMSSDPRTNPNGCIIMACTYCGLAYCRLGGKEWTPFPAMGYQIIDFTFCKGQFYARYYHGLFICHIDSEPYFTQLPPKNLQMDYLVDLAGDLLMINRFVQCETPAKVLENVHESDEEGDETEDDASSDVFRENEHESHDEDADDEIEDGLKGFGKCPFQRQDYAYVDHLTCCFSVFKLDEKGTSWTKVNDIGDQALLLGSKNSVALPTCSFPGCARNAIYYADKYWLANDRVVFNEVGNFHLKDRRIHSRHVFDVYEYNAYHQRPPPIWFVQGSLQLPES